jgi:hypothetical protein
MSLEKFGFTNSKESVPPEKKETKLTNRDKNKLELPFNLQNPDATLTISHRILQ